VYYTQCHQCVNKVLTVLIAHGVNMVLKVLTHSVNRVLTRCQRGVNRVSTGC